MFGLTFDSSPANGFNLDKAKVLSSGKGLDKLINIQNIISSKGEGAEIKAKMRHLQKRENPN